MRKVAERASTARLSVLVLVLRRSRAIKVWILGGCEPAVQIVRTRLHLLPRRAHDALDRLLGERRALRLLAAQLLPVVEQRVVQRAEALGGVRRQE